MIQMIIMSLYVMMMMAIPVMNVFLDQKSLRIMMVGIMMVMVLVMQVIQTMIMMAH